VNETAGRNLTPGSRACFSKTITEADVTSMAGITGDFDPLHMDAEYARRTRYGRRTAHPLLAAGLIMAVLHSRLPGPGAICLSQQLEYLEPIFIGDTLTAEVEVITFEPEKHLVIVKTTCRNQDARQVLTGQAALMFLKEASN
jgi:3-hydroxybutyryl-CoA dehydratase